MSILQLHEKEKRLKLQWNAPRYYDYPDGQDLMGKLSFVLKNTAALSALGGVLYANKRPKTNTFGKLVRMAQFTLPGIAMGFTFTCVTYFSAVYREKDDELNHGLGGAAAGLLLGPAMGIPNSASIGMILFGGLAYLNKNVNMQGFDVGGNVYKRSYSTYIARSIDTSLLPETQGNWVKNKST